MKNTTLVASALSLAIISVSASAGVTTGQLTFNWQGVVPTAPVTGTGWAFVDGLDIPYTPGTEQVNVVMDNTTKAISVTGVKPYDFFIVPVTGTITPGTAVTRGTTMNTVKAYLGSEPVSGGFIGNKQLALSTTDTAADGQVSITLNGKVLKVGNVNASDVAVTDAKESHVVIDVNAKATATDVAEGSSISFTAPVVFAVDI
ncbi:Cro/Cl family transcriptional regulator [Citrobacter sp. L55]|uniref:Cro/Cl family transcriptional regulator n=1 Tax=Citrobacter sp. L55 TaxID=1981983 RepID=UPI000C77BF29|nr:Cro/Cl family transcriptional regulator [Citrobacter sp. L55]PLC60645.1 Cro/Cl family transcriptional regulator [Citrobacter sp. L55]